MGAAAVSEETCHFGQHRQQRLGTGVGSCGRNGISHPGDCPLFGRPIALMRPGVPLRNGPKSAVLQGEALLDGASGSALMLAQEYAAATGDTWSSKHALERIRRKSQARALAHEGEGGGKY